MLRIVSLLVGIPHKVVCVIVSYRQNWFSKGPTPACQPAWERRYSKSILHLFIGQPDSKMDGYHSLLVVHLKMHGADAQDPFLIDIVLGLPASMCVMWLILAGPGDRAAGIFFS